MSEQWGLGWVPDIRDPRDDLHAFLVPADVAAALPSKYRPIDRLPKLRYQGRLGSCVPHGVRFAIVAADMALGVNEPIDPSRLHLYYHGRELQNTLASDSGLSIRNGIKAPAGKGYCPESLWTYSDDGVKFKQQPPPAAEQSALANRIIKYQPVEQDLTALKAAIATGVKGELDLDHPRPVAFGFTCYQSCMQAVGGDIPNPGVFDRIVGGHCVDLCGWDDTTQRFVIANWWEGWGVDGGYGTISYSYILSRMASDFWRIISVPVDDNAPAPIPPTPLPGPPTLTIGTTLAAGTYAVTRVG